MKWLFFTFITLLAFTELSAKQQNPSYQKTISPYLMSDNHPVKPALDKIFKKSRVTSNIDTFKAAGFKILPTNLRSHVVVARHPDLPGYLVKVSLDSETNKKYGEPSWLWFARRCKLARKIQSVIKKQKCFYYTVAEKWIYPLPDTPLLLDEPYKRKNEILVVTDMNLVSEEENDLAWKRLTKKHLKQLFTIITYAGGCSYRKDNIPLTKSGKFAFIDTEYPFKTPNYDTILDHLAPEMRDYWRSLVRKGGLTRKK